MKEKDYQEGEHSIRKVGSGDFVLKGYNVATLSGSVILKNSAELPETESRGFLDLQPEMIRIDDAIFVISPPYADSVQVQVTQSGGDLHLNCTCNLSTNKLCMHQSRVLYNLLERRELRAFFDRRERDVRIELIAKEYGLENEPDFDQYFELDYNNRVLQIRPKDKDLLAVNEETVSILQNQLVTGIAQIPGAEVVENLTRIVVIGQHKYYDNFQISLYDAATTKEGKVKNPLSVKNPLDILWETEETGNLKFLSAVSKFQNSHREKKPETDIAALRSVIENPGDLDFYYHNISASENVNSASIVPIKVSTSVMDIHINVDERGVFYEVSGKLILNDKALDLEKIVVKYEYFVFIQDTLHLIENVDALRVISFFRQYHQKIVIHKSKFEAFRFNVLSKLENRIKLTYSFLKPATPSQREENGYNTDPVKLIYLEDFGNYVMFTPVMKYGQTEVPVFSKKQIYSIDSHGNPFTVLRNEDEEVRFTSTLIRQHSDFEEQLGNNFFTLPKASLLDENWFLETFEKWRGEGIEVLGFSKLTKHRLNTNKAQVTVHVASGINWFDTTANVHFGKQKVSLKNLHKAVKNRSRYVALDDGTSGLLPEEWLTRFAAFFEAGEVVGETIQTAKINFAAVAEMYEAEILTREVQEQIAFLQSRFADFESIDPIAVPSGLQATLRDYQKEGLNWLNFLDDFGFGGCLADDMGLGKTIQIIAFILSQREKQAHNTNLIVVPTSLIFNWQAEIAKFAPSIKVMTVYGSGRVKDIHAFDDHEVILTSYGTLLSDIAFLKKYRFNYIFLDESQSIKNPDSQRYKAARLLLARNRIVLTGTPIENNTFDLYGQLSFACPGLLGNKTKFKNYYSIPIDRFQDYEKARELQKRINPFILRRTKKQVASELPEKTEMVLYCEMGEEQRKVYNAYELEFYTYLNTTREVDIPRESLHVLQGLTKLRQICDSPALLNDDLYYGNASAKIEVLLDQIETKSPQHKILVFSQFVTMLDLIREELTTRGIPFEYLTGQTTDREERVANFQTNNDIRVFLISLKAGGTGLNLTEADYVYLVDPWWNPAVENQAIDRSYRIGQKKNVIAVRLICPGTIEEKIMDLQESKKDLADDLIKTDVSILKSLTKKDLFTLIGK
jgi:SNF2 family DNA or RNA helicase